MKFKEGLKGKSLWNTTRHLNTPGMAPEIGEQLFGVHIYIYQFLTSNSNFKTTPNLQLFYFHKFYLSFEKNSQYTQKSPNNLQYSPEHRFVGHDCLKRERDICVKTILPSQNKAFM